MTDPLFLIVDLFCGFGGITTGFCDAEIDGNKIAKVISCVNHDPKAWAEAIGKRLLEIKNAA